MSNTSKDSLEFEREEEKRIFVILLVISLIIVILILLANKIAKMRYKLCFAV